MKKYGATVCLLATLLVSSHFGQDVWTRFQSDAEEFTVETPIALKAAGGAEAKHSRRYSGSYDGTYLFVFSDPIRDQNYASTVKRFVTESGGAFPELSGESVSSLKFNDRYGYTNELIISRTDARVYVAQAVSSRGATDGVATRFIASFSVEGRLSPVVTQAPRPPETSDIEVRRVPAGGDGRGAGIGSVTGSGFEVAAKPPPVPERPEPEVPPGHTAPFRILKKGLPSYTEWARFYGISGKVQTRVTFLGNAEIGAVSVITGLPFGLSEQAIKAARQITFEPAYRDGKPFVTTKTVEYNFSIY